MVHSVAADRTPTDPAHPAGPQHRRRPPSTSPTRDVLAPSGTFYAYEPARRLGLGDAGGLRAGLAPYTDEHDVDRLLDGLAGFLHG